MPDASAKAGAGAHAVEAGTFTKLSEADAKAKFGDPIVAVIDQPTMPTGAAKGSVAEGAFVFVLGIAVAALGTWRRIRSGRQLRAYELSVKRG